MEKPAQRMIKCKGIALQLSWSFQAPVYNLISEKSSEEDAEITGDVCDRARYQYIAALPLFLDGSGAYRIVYDNAEISVVATADLGMKRKRSIVLIKQHEK